jgi:hypothetical protein
MYRAKPFIESEQGGDEMGWLCALFVIFNIEKRIK